MVPKNTYWSGNGAQPDGDMIMDIKENEDYIMYKSHITPQSSTHSEMDIDSTVPANTSKECFRNLVIKNKALYQPQFRHRRYSEDCKTDAVQAAENSIESHRGIHDDKVLPYVQSRLEAGVTLDAHYNNTFRHRWHLWEFKKAKEAEFSEAIEAVFDMLYDAPKEKVLFVIGLGKFSSNSKLTSLHGTFGSQLTKAAHVRGYAVTGINEYYSSQKCPLNDPIDPADPCDHGFIARNNTRRCYCPKCWTYFHRDIMAAQNMIRAAQEHLTQQHRPLYLQPTDDDGNPIWQQENAAENQ
ncbi:hypothetical protein CPB97_008260 [Podila verticillata]|nr:hypothetical protein CPB97_008260 [Podila verticillata]